MTTSKKNKPSEPHFCSESGQDQMALKLVGPYGHYLEIGAHGPFSMSNTAALEQMGWDGNGIEIDQEYVPQWVDSWRDENRLIINDALTVDYSFAGHVSYLSCDIEPSANTLLALRKAVSDGVTFDFMTFEHDLYAEPQNSCKWEAREFIEGLGYHMFRENVNCPAGKPFEDWYVSDKILEAARAYSE